MMGKLLLGCALIAFSGGAWAQSSGTYVKETNCGDKAIGPGNLAYMDANGNVCGSMTIRGGSAVVGAIIPPPLTGQGYLTVSTSSAAVSTISLSPGSGAYPQPGAALPNRYVTIKPWITGTGVLSVCWLGGTCTASVGEIIAAGESQARNIGTSTTAPTVICSAVSACPITVEW